MTASAPRAEFSARYLVESPDPLPRVADVIAGEQSSGTFLALGRETDELKARARARVVRIETLAPALHPSLASAMVARRGHEGVFNRGIVEIAFPLANIGGDLSTLMATVAGNLYELGEVTGLRLLELRLPDAFIARQPGSRFGVAGTRERAGVPSGPLVGSIIKPSIGLSPQDTAAVVDELCQGDIDFIKDDELTVSPDYAPFEARLAAVMPVLQRHADRLGRMPMYAINLSGTLDEMRRRHDMVLAAGGSCVMVSVNAVGLAGVQALREHSQLPIHGHRNGWGQLTRHPMLGMDFRVFQALWRLAGIDQLHVNGLQSKFWEPDDSVVASARALLAPLGPLPPAMPVFSSGQWAGQAPAMYEALGGSDLMHLAGGGIIGHPGGIGAGVRSMREAWEAARAGVDLARHAQARPALRAALERFGNAA